MVTVRRTLVRSALVLGVGAAVTLPGAVAAGAQQLGADVEPSPSPSVTDYPPPEEPTLTAEIFEPVCDGDVPYLQYRVSATGTTNDTLTMTWINPTGDDVVYADLPLEGRVLWPGAVVDADGNPVDWPGWRLVDGQWVEGDEFDWVRPSVDVSLEVNPTLTLNAPYPPSSPNCSANPPGSVPSPAPNPGGGGGGGGTTTSSNPGGLAVTGADVARFGAVALGLVMVGGAAVVVSRRRRA
jgi:hypothetical protein